MSDAIDWQARALAAEAILAGSDVPPTQDEIRAHSGRWLVMTTDAGPYVASTFLMGGEAWLTSPASYIRVRWWPLDENGAPCARPMVSPQKGSL